MSNEQLHKLKITISSNRLYYDEQNFADGILSSLDDTFEQFNILMEWTYNRIYDNRVLKVPYTKTLTQMMKDEYTSRYHGRLLDYYASSIYTVASGLVSSQEELFKQYVKDFFDRMQNRQAKIELLKESLARKQAVKDLLAERSRCIKAGVWFDDSVFHIYGMHITNGDSVLFYPKKNRQAVQSIYHYECMIDHQIRHLKSRIALIHEKIRRSEETRLHDPKRATFGTRKQYRMKDTKSLTGKELQNWHDERNKRRFASVSFNGRHTSAYGNFVCRYHPIQHTCEITLMNGSILRLNDVSFPYRGDDLTAFRLKEDHRALGYTLERHNDAHGRDYLILKASFDVANDRCNHDTGDGVIAADINTDHLAWADVRADGSLIESGTIRFDLNNLSSAQAKSVLGHACNVLTDTCTERHKPLAIENLKIKSVINEYDDPGKNKKLSSFAYSTLSALMEGQALKKSIGLIKVNPSYTSMLGKIKHMKPYGISIHCSAAYVIGRRAMGFKERLPSFLRNKYYSKARDGTIKNTEKKTYTAYRYIFNHIKKAPVDFWYQTVSFNTWKEFESLVNQYNSMTFAE